MLPLRKAVKVCTLGPLKVSTDEGLGPPDLAVPGSRGALSDAAQTTMQITPAVSARFTRSPHPLTSPSVPRAEPRDTNHILTSAADSRRGASRDGAPPSGLAHILLFLSEP